jgi:sugar fermentation stimulation protein A
VTGTRPTVPLAGPLIEASFVERPNRFLLHCRIRDETVRVHMADPGRLRELLVPGARLRVRHTPAPHRSTAWTAVLVESPGGDGWISLDTTLPNALTRRALEAEALEEFEGWTLHAREWRHGRSRLDFLLHGPAIDEPGGAAPPRLALEVKSVTLVVDGVARFPDAVTARGTRHVRELAELAGRPGWHAALLFVLQRDDAERIEAARSIDPAFAAALDEAHAAGVRIHGRRCRVGPDAVTLGGRVPVLVGE